MVMRTYPGASRRFFLAGLVGCFLVLGMQGAHALSPPPPEGYLFDWYELAWDDATLVRYLCEGIPQVAVKEGQGAANYPATRWRLYEEAVELLGKHGHRDAVDVLVRLVDEPLPDFIIDDAVLKSAASSANPLLGWEDWDRALADDTLSFKGGCASVLSRLDRTAGVETALRLLERNREPVLENLRKADGTDGLTNAYSLVCRLLMQMGRREGVDALVSLLPLTYLKPGGSNVAEALNWVAGAPDLPDGDVGRIAYEQAVRQWVDWWAVQGDSYVPRLEPPKRDYVYPPPEEADKADVVRSYIAASLEYEYHGALKYPEAQTWLNANAEKYGKQLRALAEDPTQPRWIAVKATEVLAATGSRAAYKWLRTRLLEGQTEDAGQLLYLVKQHFPGKYAETALACLDRGGRAGEAAANSFVGGSPEEDGAQVMLERYDELVVRYPSLRSSALQHFAQQPRPGDEVVFFNGIRSEDIQEAIWAAKAIKERGLEDKLPEEARKAYEARMQDPYVRLSLLDMYRGGAGAFSEAAEIVRSVEGVDAAAAHVFALGYQKFAGHSGRVILPEAEFCLQKLQACVAAYRASRGG